ncbi:peptidyl-prolyl cis-trans isomerase SurA [Loktanella sp. DSM 29012]|uniref:peptidylprolyl isomerase n=1 Tax=Loktanella sp. DSM 29012 TaxID=1881056 RepID=UPI0008B5847C|nr:peptidylprolyl isomerase [Loktanella sp. DSM 29012]SEQ24961.1 peptidyl-prolyl cis-trans isomerase SurA [Loktanella sp. DSM 29012]
MRLTTILTSLVLACATPAIAQDRFAPVITVNDAAITAYELDQRARMLQLFRTPGNLTELAREQLIEERLKAAELDRRRIRLSAENLATEVDAFAARANLTTDQFIQLLNQNGVDRATLEQFVAIGVSWRDYIRLRFGNQAEISEEEVRRAMRQPGSNPDAIEVLLSEIIIPAPPPEAARANAIANQISQTRSTAVFENAARQYSALPSRNNGGRLNWLPLLNYPPALQGLLGSLAPGEVTQPILIPNGVALFQSRGIREVPQPRPAPTAIDYAIFGLPGGTTEAGLAAAQSLDARTDTCDDLYGAARGLPQDVLARQTVSPDSIPQDVALELARLDPGEASWNLTRDNGQTRIYLMLCDRTLAGAENNDPEAVRNALRSQRLGGFADALLADLRAAATIRP